MTNDHIRAQQEIEKYLHEYPYGYQDENGIDLSLIIATSE